ncbi:MAG: hypothetical protein AABZ10_08795 [Nitrospirota bacterium]
MKNKLWITGIVIALAVVLVSGVSKGGINSSDPVVTTIAGEKMTSGSTDGTGTAARFNFAAGITTDGTNLYVADTYNHTIRKVVISTAEVTTLAGTAGVSGSTDGTGAAALFNYPQGITMDGTNLYIADTNNYTIRKVVISTGEVTTLAGTAGAFGSTDESGPAARFGAPSGITTDGTSLYVADTWNGTIRKIVISTGEVTTLAGTAGAFGSADGTGADARFSYTTGIASDGTNLYVVDNRSNTIRKIVIATGDVTTLAGTAGVSGSTDGTGSAAFFFSPQAITRDETNLYVADTANRTIRKIVIPTGEVTTLAGAAGAPGSTDGSATAARFGAPYGITTDGTSLYVTDRGTIRKIQ